MFSLSSTLKAGNHPTPFYSGFLVSFVGSLPPGTVNILLIQLAIEDYGAAAWFALGSVVAEIVCVRLCLILMNRILKFQFIIRILQWIVLIVLVSLSMMSFAATSNGMVHSSSPMVLNTIPPFLFGFLIMIINPVQLPFWLGWTTILFEKNVLVSGGPATGYITGIATGSLIACALFIVGGKALSSFLSMEQYIMQLVFGCVFAVMALVQVKQIIRHRRKIIEGQFSKPEI